MISFAEGSIWKKQIKGLGQCGSAFEHTPILVHGMGNHRYGSQAYCQAELSKGQAVRRRLVQITSPKKEP